MLILKIENPPNKNFITPEPEKNAIISDYGFFNSSDFLWYLEIFKALSELSQIVTLKDRFINLVISHSELFNFKHLPYFHNNLF